MKRKLLIPVAVGSVAFGIAGAVLAQYQASQNWAGYVAFENPDYGPFDLVAGTFKIPSVAAQPIGQNDATYSSFWVGFDGYNNQTLEGCGVQANNVYGTTQYYAYYELYPTGSFEVPLTVDPGDTINVAAYYNGEQSGGQQFLFYFDDMTTGKTYSYEPVSATGNDTLSTAEWIASASSTNGVTDTLAPFSAVSFTNAVASDGNGTASGPVEPISRNGPYSGVEMVQSGQTFATPTSLNSTGGAFNIYQPGAMLAWNNAGEASPADGKSWDIGVNNNWNDGTNPTFYSDGTTVYFGDLNNQNNGNYAVTIATAVQPTSVIIQNYYGNYIFAGSGGIAGTCSLLKTGSAIATITTQNSYTGGTSVHQGTLVMGASGALPYGPVTVSGGELQLAANTGASVVSSLSMSANGVVDITNNTLLINYGGGPDPISSVAAWLRAGYNGGAWNGLGIISSTAQASSLSYGIGYADSGDSGNPAGLSSGTIEVKYTLLGDANLDGVVNGIDFGILAANFNKGVSGWDQGDCDYDNVVNGIDFAELAANFNKGAMGTSIGLPAYDDPAIVAFAQANGLVADLTSIPEPMTASLMLVPGFALLARRRASRATR